MIPLRLRLRNFLSYRELPELDLEGIHVACLTGSNGHGKSALLDAMTWALWGKARAKSDDELVHQGQTEMEVDFEFLVGEERYRVVRQRRRGGGGGRPGHTTLHLQVAGPAGLRSLDGDGVRETERRIVELLRMNYETFVNSAFLLQGRADAFTIKRPAERKEILAEILGLSFYEELAQRAKEQARGHGTEVARLRGRLEQADAALGQRPQYESELREVEGLLAEAEPDLGAAQREVDRWRAAVQLYEERQRQRHQLEERRQEAEGKATELAGQMQELARQIAELEAIVAHRDEIERQYVQLVDARRREREGGARLQQLRAVEARKQEAQRALDQARLSLEHQLEAAERERQRLSALAGELPQLEQSLKEVQGELAALATREEQVARRAEEAAERERQAHALEERNKTLEREIKDLHVRFQQLKGEGVTCPLCAQPLRPEDRDHIRQEYRQLGTAKQEEVRANRVQLEELQREAQGLRREAERLKAALQAERDRLRGQEGRLQTRCQDAEAAAAALPGQERACQEIPRILESGQYAPEARRLLAEAAAEEEAIGYDDDAHAAARDEAAALASYDERYQGLGRAGERLGLQREALQRTQAERAEWQKRAETAARELAALSLPAEEPHGALQQAKDRLRQRSEERDRLLRAQAATQQQLSELDQMAEQRRAAQVALREAAEEQSLCEELARAFGKEGVQALLIEEALPELQAEANAVLARMTDNRMHVRLETQRERKSGGQVETLDIRIGDEVGTRAYELYSGGEAFRINFALRVALSRLLARRAGAPLPTLVIDEGFGTQDSAGRERLLEAIRSVQDEFRCLLVITHIEELRDAFPVRIEVTKAPDGSSTAQVTT